MRVLHLLDRLSDRGGAYWHAYGVVAALAERGHRVRLAVGADDGSVDPPCPVDVVPGLAARTRAAVDLGAVVTRLNRTSTVLGEARAGIPPHVVFDVLGNCRT